MICPICRQAEITGGHISLPLQRGEMILTVNDVPAAICPSCAEGYLEEDVTMRVLQAAERIFLSGSIESTYAYEELILQF